MDNWIITVTGTWSDKIQIMAENEAQARMDALDTFEDVWAVSDTPANRFKFDKVEIALVQGDVNV